MSSTLFNFSGTPANKESDEVTKGQETMTQILTAVEPVKTNLQTPSRAYMLKC